MRVEDARGIARDWVAEHAAKRADFVGAYFSGSTGALPPDAPMPLASDVDIVIVLSVDNAPRKLGKFRERGVLLEVTYAAAQQYTAVAEVARDFHLSPSFRGGQIIADPSGTLGRAEQAIAPTFAEPGSIRVRRDSVLERIRTGLDAFEATVPWHQQVMSWMFPASITTHAVLVAALANPTVRLRYRAAGAVLAASGRPEVYEELLDQLGASKVSAESVAYWLKRLEPVFDDAARVGVTPFIYSSDVSADARVIAIDGSRELIEAGEHREAVFWVIATYTRCMTILTADAPALADEHDAAFRAAATELLGVATTADLHARAERTQAYLPQLRAITDDITDEISDGTTAESAAESS